MWADFLDQPKFREKEYAPGFLRNQRIKKACASDLLSNCTGTSF